MQIRREMSYDYEGREKGRSVDLVDILWAVDFLDHLDTVGLAMGTKEYALSQQQLEDDDGA